MPSPGPNPAPQPQRAPQPWQKHGLVSNEKFAKEISRTVFQSTFGIKPLEPLVARNETGVWDIQGAPLPPGTMGGNLYIQICQSNGRVLNLYGTQ